MRRITIAIAALTAGVVAAQGAGSTRPTSLPANIKDYVYKKTEQATLKLHVYSPTDLKRGDKRPAIVFFFGGGWNRGSANQFTRQAAYLARRGMVAATADYRVRKRHNVLPDKCVEDAKSAVRWMRKNADQLGIDPDRIAAGGGSAGAHLAACTALTDGLEAPGEEHSISSKPNALILFNPVLDLSSPKAIERVGGNEALALQISPQHQLKKGAPPTLLLFGTADRLFTQAGPFIKRAKELGNRIELYTAEGAQHGFFNRGPWYERTLARADEFLVSIGYLSAKTARRAKRPNIVIIMADDMGFSDIGCYGSEIATPNLDALAAGGLRFTHFYNTARCCPTRASLLTGLYSHQTGVGHMLRDRHVPGYRGFLNDRCVTIAEVLREEGYATLMSGKWHVGSERPHWPVDRGFDHYFGLVNGGSNYWKIIPGRILARDDQQVAAEEDGFYMTDAFTNSAVAFIDRHGRESKPFFLYVAYTAPHWPLHAWPEDIAKYRGKYLTGWDALRKQRHQRMIGLGLVDAAWPLTTRDPRAPAWQDVEDKEALDLKMAVYAAQIDRMDQGIGKIVAKLWEVGAERDTLVLFLADNGGCAEKVDRGEPGAPPGPKESFLSYGLPWANASNTPFRLYKHWVHEGGIATPLIAYWPKVIKKGGELTHQAGHVIDLMATCIDVAGATYPTTDRGREIIPLEGKSLVPILEGRIRKGHDQLFWEHTGNRAVRRGKWKLVAQHERPWELYDLEADRTELNDLASQHPDKVEQLREAYEQWAKRCNVVPWSQFAGKKAKRKR